MKNSTTIKFVHKAWNEAGRNCVFMQVQCVGVDHYVNALGEHRTALHKRTQYVPQGLKGLNHVLLGGLKPNFVYSCNVTEELVNQEHRGNVNRHCSADNVLLYSHSYYVCPGVPSRTKSFNEFATGYAGEVRIFIILVVHLLIYTAPEAPRAPVIHTSHDDGNTNVTVELFRATTKNGPIRYYRICTIITMTNWYFTFVLQWLHGPVSCDRSTSSILCSRTAVD